MKPKLSLGVCILISLALVFFGLCYGTLKGFTDERSQVDAFLHGESGLTNMLYYRGSDGLNLCVVANRHLTADADVAALETAAKALRNEKSSLTEKKQADDRLRAATGQVAKKLLVEPDFLLSARDKAYLDMLQADMEQLSQSGMISGYNEAAQDFNRQLAAPFSGSIAKLLGVKPCDLYQ